MGLLLIPINDLADSINSNQLGPALSNFLEHLRSQDPLQSKEGSIAELSQETALDRVQIVPWRTAAWKGEQWKKWQHRSTLRCQEPSDSLSEEESFRERILVALSYCIQLISYQRLRTERLIIVPILPELSSTYSEENLVVLGQLRRILDQCITQIFFEHLRMNDDSIDLPIDIEYYPWLFFVAPPSIQDLPSFLFKRPDSFQQTEDEAGTHPWIYTARSHKGELRQWEGYGSSRLLTDLYFFYANTELDILHHAISRKNERNNLTFARYNPHQKRCFIMGHSSLFEFPLEEKLRLKQLEALLSSSGHDAMLPSKQDLLPLINQYKERSSIRKDVQFWLKDLKENYQYPPVMPTEMKERLRFNPERNDPDFAKLLRKPSKDRWQYILSNEWPLIQPNLSIPTLFTEVYAALEQRSTENMDTQLEQELKRTRAAIEVQTSQLQINLENILQNGTIDTEEEPSKGLLENSIGSTFAYLYLLLEELEKLDDRWEDSEENKDNSDPEEYLASLVDVREKWLNEEKQLMEEGNRLPSEAAIFIEAIAIVLFFATLGAAIPLAFLFTMAIGGVLGAAVAYYRVQKREQELEVFFEKWIDFQQRIEEESNKIALSFGEKVLVT